LYQQNLLYGICIKEVSCTFKSCGKYFYCTILSTAKKENWYDEKEIGKMKSKIGEIMSRKN